MLRDPQPKSFISTAFHRPEGIRIICIIIINLLKTGTTKEPEILYIPIAVGMNSNCFDRIWAENMCLALATHAHPQVRGNAMTGLGHIARIFREISLETVIPAISRNLADIDEDVRGYAADAARDIHLYLGIVVPDYDTEYTNKFLDVLNSLRQINME